MKHLSYLTILWTIFQSSALHAKDVRVLLTKANEIKVACTSRYQLANEKGTVVAAGYYLPLTQLSYFPNKGWFLADEYLGQSSVMTLESKEDAAIVCGSKRYRGFLQFRVDEKSQKIWVINHLSLEPYIRGVVSREMLAEWPAQALEVQSIVARTYTLDRMAAKKYPNYDVNAGVASQVYGGVLAEYPSTNRAVERTNRLVLRYGDDLVTTYYHSACAGQTEASHQVWDVKSPALQGVICGFCTKSSQQNWRVSWSGRELSKKLKSFPGASSSRVKTVKVWDKTASKRVRWLEVLYVDGTSIKMSGNTFRLKLGADRLRSTRFELSQKGNAFSFYGHGWGHGVGLCQWGAKFMADEGYSMKDILTHYYPGTMLGTI